MMLFLAPEGAVVDHNDMARKYIADCQKFCIEAGFKPFEYVLTPRYKGLTCLSEHVKEKGEIVSVTMAFVQDGKLLDEKLLSPNRVIPDLYSLFAGWGGSPTTVYVYCKKLPNFDGEKDDIKQIMMKDYEMKDQLLRGFHEKGHFPAPPVLTKLLDKARMDGEGKGKPVLDFRDDCCPSFTTIELFPNPGGTFEQRISL